MTLKKCLKNNKKSIKFVKKLLTFKYQCAIITSAVEKTAGMEAQLSWESICLTSRGSQVRALLFPPFFIIKAKALVQEHECGIPHLFQMRPGSSVGQNASLSRQRSGVRVPFGSPLQKQGGRNKRSQANASVAQWVEQGTENPRVVGSIPTGGTTKCGFSSFGRASPCQGEGGGFEPRNPQFVVPPVGIEPTTRGFSVPCSTN